MAERTQLNVNISPELLKTLKHNAIKSGMTLATYVTDIIKLYVNNENLLEEDSHIDKRIESMELQLEAISNQLDILNSTQKREKPTQIRKITGFSKEGSIAFGKTISKFFIEECKDRGLTTQEAVIELTPHIQSTFNIKYWGPLIEMFSENKILTTPDLMYEVYMEHGEKCPMLDLFYKWCGKEPQMIEEKFLKAVIN